MTGNGSGVIKPLVAEGLFIIRGAWNVGCAIGGAGRVTTGGRTNGAVAAGLDAGARASTGGGGWLTAGADSRAGARYCGADGVGKRDTGASLSRTSSPMDVACCAGRSGGGFSRSGGGAPT